MATKVILTEQYLKDIANAIREKSGSQSPLKPSEMASAIKHIHQGIDPEGTLEITESGTYNVTQYATAEVDIPISPLETQVNGVYQKEDGGYNPVTVSVPPYSDPNRTKTITENGTYTFKSRPSGTGEQPPAVIQVAVPNPATGTKSITENGTHNVKDYEYAAVDVPPYGEGTTDIVTGDASGTYDVDGYKYAHVSVSMDELEVTQNGTYQPRYGQMIAGYSKVKVNVPNPATGTKNITENGTHNIKDYEFAEVDVPPYGEGDTDIVLAASQGTYDVDGYKRANISVSMDELEVTKNGTYQPRYDQMIAGYNKVKVNVPSTLTPEDEGKVVENGTLVSQSTKQITQNGTYDTTKNNSVVVVIPTAVNKTTIEDATIYKGAIPTVGTPLTIISTDVHPAVGDEAIVLGIRVYTYQGSAHRAYYLIEGVVSSLDATNNRFTMTPDTVIEDVVKVSGGLVIDSAGTYTRDVTEKKTVSVNIEAGYESSDVKMIPARYITAHTGDPSTDTYIYVTLTENDMYDLDVSQTGTLVCTEFGTYMVTGIIQNKKHNTQDDTYTLEIEVVNQIS